MSRQEELEVLIKVLEVEKESLQEHLQAKEKQLKEAQTSLFQIVSGVLPGEKIEWIDGRTTKFGTVSRLDYDWRGDIYAFQNKKDGTPSLREERIWNMESIKKINHAPKV